MKDLMRLKPEVAPPRKQAFRYTQCINECTQYVECGHCDETVNGLLHLEGRVRRGAILETPVSRGENSGEAKKGENERTYGAKTWLTEAFHDGADHRDGAQHERYANVDTLQCRVTVEAIVDPRDVGAHDKYGNATVVESKERKPLRSSQR